MNINNKYFTLGFVILVFIVGFIFYLSNPEPIEYKAEKPKSDGTVCSADAFLCPDGSYIGRSGPNCEFKCPQTQ